MSETLASPSSSDTVAAPAPSGGGRSYVVRTLGCKANFYDSQLLESDLQNRGVAPHADEGSPESVEVCIVNSCTVTDEADRQSRKLAARLKREYPNAKIVFTGCGAEVAPESLIESRGIDFVVGNLDKPELVDLVYDRLAKAPGDAAQGAAAEVLGRVTPYGELVSRHPMDREWPAPEKSFFTSQRVTEGFSARTRAFLKVQEGCNSFCTYCIIPYGRGPNRSLPIADVVSQVKELVAGGVREVVITGTNIGDYGMDWAEAPQHDALFEAILSETKLERLRVSSLDPTEVTPRILDLARRDSRFCPHFHISLQSPHTRVLKTMKRKYAAEHVRECLTAIATLSAAPGGAFVGMDVITGFPGETAEEFDWTVAELERLPWSRLHVFPYSEREGTPATRIPGSVPVPERQRRAKVLRELSFARLRGIHERALGEYRDSGALVENVLLESTVTGPDGKRTWVSGYSPNYLRVLFPLPEGATVEALSNRMASVRPMGLFQDAQAGDVALTGVLVEDSLR